MDSAKNPRNDQKAEYVTRLFNKTTGSPENPRRGQTEVIICF